MCFGRSVKLFAVPNRDGNTGLAALMLCRPPRQVSGGVPRSEGAVMKMNLPMTAVVGFCLGALHCSAQGPMERANRDAQGEVLCMAIASDGQTTAGR